MTLLDMINNSLSDESTARDEYQDMMDLASKDENLTEEEKGLIVGILFKIQTDEKTHKILLNIIKEVLSTK